MVTRGSFLSVLAAGCAALACAAPAHGAAVIGSDLATTATANNGCNLVTCTTANLTLIGSSQAPAGLTSPVNGTVTSWTMRSGSAGNLISLRVLRPATGAVTYTGAGTSAPGMTGSAIDGPFQTSLPISIGDSIGLENPSSATVIGNNGGASQVFWNMPPLADGATRTGTVGAGFEVLVQAVVVPDNAVKLRRIVRNVKKGIAKVFVDVPNAGSLSFGGKRVKVGKGPTTTAGPATIKLNVKAAGKKAKKLKRKGKVGVKPVVTFTPTLGEPRSTPIKFALKRRR